MFLTLAVACYQSRDGALRAHWHSCCNLLSAHRSQRFSMIPFGYSVSLPKPLLFRFCIDPSRVFLCICFCICFAFALHLLCVCFPFALHLLCICFAFALHLLCICFAFALHLLAAVSTSVQPRGKSNCGSTTQTLSLCICTACRLSLHITAISGVFNSFDVL